MTVSFNHAAGAYRDATRVAERIIDQVEGAGGAGASDGASALKPSFSNLVTSGLDEARNSGYQGEMLSSKSIAGTAQLHELVTAVSNAELTLNAVVAVRDKVIGAYQDIIKMPI